MTASRPKSNIANIRRAAAQTCEGLGGVVFWCLIGELWPGWLFSLYCGGDGVETSALIFVIRGDGVETRTGTGELTWVVLVL